MGVNCRLKIQKLRRTLFVSESVRVGTDNMFGEWLQL
jgi:hypothetical protein